MGREHIAGYRIAADQSAGMRAASQPAPAYWPRLSESASREFSRRVHCNTDLAEFLPLLPTSADRLGIRRVERLGAYLCQRKELRRKPYHPVGMGLLYLTQIAATCLSRMDPPARLVATLPLIAAPVQLPTLGFMRASLPRIFTVSCQNRPEHDQGEDKRRHRANLVDQPNICSSPPRTSDHLQLRHHFRIFRPLALQLIAYGLEGRSFIAKPAHRTRLAP